MKLSYPVATPECKAKKMLCFRGDLDPTCEKLKAFGYDGFITMEIEQRPDSATTARRAAHTIRALLESL